MQSITYENLFVTPFVNALKIDKTIMDMINNNKSELLLDYMLSKGCEYYYLDDFMIMQAINVFTLKDIDKDILKNHISCVKSQQNVKSIEILEDVKYNIPKMLIERENDLIEILPFSKLVPESLKCIPNLEETSREGCCFELVSTLAKAFKMKASIATGYIYGLTDKSKCLHSWIETVLDGKEVVIDLILNAIFNKEGYYSLMKTQKKQEISFFDFRDDILSFLINLNDCVDTLPLETYLYFRDELMNDLKKNELIFNAEKRMY